MKPRRRRYYAYTRADGGTGWEDKMRYPCEPLLRQHIYT